MTEREQLQILWKLIDQMHTAAQDVKRGRSSSDRLAEYVLRKAQEARQAVDYPGEPPDALWEEETRPDDDPKH